MKETNFVLSSQRKNIKSFPLVFLVLPNAFRHQAAFRDEQVKCYQCTFQGLVTVLRFDKKGTRNTVDFRCSNSPKTELTEKSCEA
jgi:hypothetical protein